MLSTFVEFKIHQVLALVTDPTFDSAELLLFGSAQMTEPFSAEHRTFFFTIHCIFQHGYVRYFKLGLCKQCYQVETISDNNNYSLKAQL